jgi:thiol-disulfide isomerase/thioredoxin
MSRTLVAALLALAAAGAHALTLAPYSADALAKAQRAGQPVALHFHAGWCPTCRAQRQAFDMLAAEPGLDLTILVADYDRERDLRKALKVRAQSTLIVYHGSTERTRLTGETDLSALRDALRRAL